MSTYHIAAASSDFNIFNLFDTDEIELSQICEKMDTENNSCKLFGLRGHDEHYELECDQFTIGSDHRGRFITFTGRSTKTYLGGLKDLELKNKKITHYCQEGERCLAEYFEKYLNAMNNTGIFYCCPLAGQPICYGTQAIGINKLKTMMKYFFSKISCFLRS